MFVKMAELKKDITFNPYQERVLNNPSTSMIVAHAVGSGKTLTGIAKFEKLKREGKATKALVVVPAGLRENFGGEGVKKFTNSKYNIIGNKVEASSGQYKGIDPDSDYNIMSYEMFRQNPQKYIKESGADTVIADEMHRLRNEGLSTVESFQKTRPLYKNFIGLTGSLVNNSVSDVQPLVDIASGNEHKLGPNKKGFEKLFIKRNEKGPYKKMKESRRPITGFKFPKQLSAELNKYIDYADNADMKDIAKIPTKVTKVTDVPISEQQLKIYKGILSKNPAVAKLITRKRLETLKGDEIATAYNQLIEARKLMNSVGSVMPGMDLTTSAKVTPKAKKILDDLQSHISKTPDGQAILLTNLIRGGADVLEAGLKERGIPYGEFIGKGNKGITEETRQKAIKDYQSGKNKVMVISGAGAEGISLGDTTWEGLFDPHYNPERMYQMEARGVRARGLSKRAPQDRQVEVNRYKSTVPKFLGIFKKYPYKTPDEVIYEIANNKDAQNQMLYKLLKDTQKKPKEMKV